MNLLVFTVLLLITATSGDIYPGQQMPVQFGYCMVNDLKTQPFQELTYNARGRQSISISCLMWANPMPTVTITAGLETVNQVNVSPLDSDMNKFVFNHTFYAIDTSYSGQWIISFDNGLRPCWPSNCQFPIDVNVDAETVTLTDLWNTPYALIAEPFSSSGLVAFQSHSCDDKQLCFLPSGTPTGNGWTGDYACLIPVSDDETTVHYELWAPDAFYEEDFQTVSFPPDCPPKTSWSYATTDIPFWFMTSLQQSGGNPNTVQVTLWTSPQHVYNTPLNATNPKTFSFQVPYVVTQLGIGYYIENNIIVYPNAA